MSKPRHSKASAAIREEAAELAVEAARQREQDGDPEGANVLRDLSAQIRRIRLTEIRS